MSAAVAHQWQRGDAEPTVGTAVLRADGVRTVREPWGWMPGPYNWIGILSLGPPVDDTPPETMTRYGIVDKTDPEAMAAWHDRASTACCPTPAAGDQVLIELSAGRIRERDLPAARAARVGAS